MVSSLPFDILAAPTVAIQDIFDKHIQSQSSEDFSNVLSNRFKEIFGNSSERLALIPHLDAILSSRVEPSTSSSGPTLESSLKLVQFRGMVQDTSASPELYLSRLKNGSYGGWGVHEMISGDVDYTHLRECTRYWVVSIPGQTQWAANNSPDDTAILIHSNLPQHAHKFPLPTTPHIGLSVNVYSAQADADLKSTDIVTFVGLFESERNTLHVLFHLRENAVQEDYRAYPLEKGLDNGAQALRHELVSWIADEALAGDRDAAEWVLLSVISRVQSRNPPIMPTSLTLARFPPPVEASSTIPALYTVLALLVPIIALIPLSLPLLNEGSFIPESKPRPQSDNVDEDPEDELHSGILQLVPSTLCLITDSSITEGRINDRGVRNLRALQEIIRNQTLEYVFPYSGFRFETDIGCIVCTEGKQCALVETHVTVPLTPAAESLSSSEIQRRLYKSTAEIVLPPAEKLQSWRKLIGGAMAKQMGDSSLVGGISVSDAAADYIQEEFVKERQDSAKEGGSSTLPTGINTKSKGITTPDDLIHRMLIAKLLTLSIHEPEVSIDVWEQMKELEKRRLTKAA